VPLRASPPTDGFEKLDLYASGDLKRGFEKLDFYASGILKLDQPVLENCPEEFAVYWYALTGTVLVPDFYLPE